MICSDDILKTVTSDCSSDDSMSTDDSSESDESDESSSDGQMDTDWIKMLSLWK